MIYRNIKEGNIMTRHCDNCNVGNYDVANWCERKYNGWIITVRNIMAGNKTGKI